MKQKNNLDQALWDFHQTTNITNLRLGHPRQDLIYKLVTRHISLKSKILEIGFGDGYLLNKLSLKYKCYGADISPKNIHQIKKTSSKISFKLVNQDGKLPYSDMYFDTFIASEVLEHMSDKELNKTISEIQRILKDKGKAFITVPANEKLDESICFCPKCNYTFHRWGHKQVFDTEKIKKIFDNFKKVSITKIPNVQNHINIIEDIRYFIRKQLIKLFPNNFVGTYIIILIK